jgi:acyl-coenzyme A thioesterase PaaI-like protein
MSYPAAVHVGDVLTARAVEQQSTRKLAFCEVTVTNQHEKVVGYFRGTAYRTDKLHLPDGAMVHHSIEERTP